MRFFRCIQVKEHRSMDIGKADSTKKKKNKVRMGTKKECALGLSPKRANCYDSSPSIK
jgi:hypothetical protein